MKILQITKYYYPNVCFGGPVQCTYNISNYMVRRGHDVTVYTTDAADTSTDVRTEEGFQLINGVKVFFFRNLVKLYGFFISPAMIRALRKSISDFDVVHLHEYRTFQNLAFYYSSRRNVPYVLSVHGEFEYEQESWDYFFLRRMFNIGFGTRLLKDASKLFAVTDTEASHFIQSGIPKDKIVTIPNAINPEDFSNPPPEGYFRTLFGLANEEIVLYLGRIGRFKGLDVLVKAFSLLRRDNVKLVLAGPDDGFLEPLQRIVASLRLRDKVLFTGTLSRKLVAAALKDASIVVYASLQEGFPIVPLEAGMMEKPVIVSNHPSMEFVKEGRFGLAVEYGNIAQLGEALEKILGDQGLAKELGTNGRKFVLENFAWDVIAGKIENTYCQISG
ncbi:MAG: glycosyltransferase family 4 protein [Candidatus Bathyarchaeota archaeon]|nr:glycosyltransferase family 4 protein [Candidatus Bathyarchaeota archaeon]